MRNNSKYYGNNISFVDMLFNIIIVFALIFFAAVLLMNEPAKKKDLEAKADIIVTMSWPDLSPHDIDLWIKVPDGLPIGYTHKENSYLFLERDDLGISNNYVIKDGEKTALSPRREVASFRGKIPGRYVINVQFFMGKTVDGKGLTANEYDGISIPVEVELIQINPVYKVLGKKTITLTQNKEERTAFAFIIRDDIVTELSTEIEEPFIFRNSFSDPLQ
jgi:hypothetical protein